STCPEEDQPTYVGLFHELPVRWCAETEAELDGPAAGYYVEHLPRRPAARAGAQAGAEPSDAIAVGEPQGLADIARVALLPCLRDPEHGVLFVFTDEHQTVFDREGRAPITLNPFPLDDNLRSTRAIARTFAPLTPLEQTPRMDEGAPVRYVASTAQEAT